MHLLPENLGVLAKLCNGVNATAGVQLTTKDRTYRAAVTNGKSAAMVAGVSGDVSDYPDVPALVANPSTHTEAVIPAKAWTAAFKSVPKRCKPALRNVAVTMQENGTTLATTDLDTANVSQPRSIDGRFPDVAHVMPTSTPDDVFIINPDLMAELLRVAATFRGKDDWAITMEVRKGKPIVLRVSNAEQEFIGLMTTSPVKE